MHIGTITILSIFAILTIFEQYAAILVSILMMGFYALIIRSNQYPKITKFFDDTL